MQVFLLGGCGTAADDYPLRLASGTEGMIYRTLAKGFAGVLESNLEGVTVDALPTSGSRENMRLLETGQCDLALVQSDTPGSGPIRTLAVLYDEILHVLVRTNPADPVDDLLDLRGTVVSVGPKGSGTASVVGSLLDHFGLTGNAVDRRFMAVNDALAAFEKGELDAVFILSGLKSDPAARLLSTGHAQLLSLGAVDRVGTPVEGVGAVFPYLYPAAIPARTYGAQPEQPVGTIGVKALLVATSRLDDGLAADITRTLFENRAELAKHHQVALHIREAFHTAETRFPYHNGAVAYYTRDEPPFVVRHAETLSLVFTVLLAVGSALLAFRQWYRRVKKNRIDVYYQEVARIASLPEGATRESLEQSRASLQQLQRKAFDELIAERLAADASFTIFQDYLKAEIAEVDRKIGGVL